MAYFPTYEGILPEHLFGTSGGCLDIRSWSSASHTIPKQPYLDMVISSSTITAPFISRSTTIEDPPSSFEHSVMFLPSFFVPVSIGRKPTVGTEFDVQHVRSHRPATSL